MSGEIKIEARLLDVTALPEHELLVDFTEPKPFSVDTVADAPATPGVHVVLDRDSIIYVGWSGNLRRRLRQHLTGNRESSVLHEQVGEVLDAQGDPASAPDIADWLGRCTVSWRESATAEELKASMVVAFSPRFNRRIERT
jgi:hypothetical protein